AEQQIGGDRERHQQQQHDDGGRGYHVEAATAAPAIVAQRHAGLISPRRGKTVINGEKGSFGRKTAISSHAPTPPSHTRYVSISPRCLTSVPTLPSVNADAVASRSAWAIRRPVTVASRRKPNTAPTAASAARTYQITCSGMYATAPRDCASQGRGTVR